MKADTKEQETIMLYLLGQVTAEDLPPLEERLLSDKSFYEELLIVEDELIDRYLSDDLSPEEQENFKTHFLCTPERQRKVRFGRALSRYVSTAEPPPDEELSNEDSLERARDVPEPPPKPFFSFLPFRNPFVTYALATVVLLMVGGLSWLAFKNLRNPTSREAGQVLAVTLTPGLTRDGGKIQRFAIPSGTETVRLQLNLSENQYPSYEVALQDAEGKTLMRRDGLKTQSPGGRPAVVVDLEPRLIPAGDYQLKLNGRAANGSFDSVGSYPFRVLSK